MSARNWFRPPRHLLAMFLGLTVISTAALGWLSWELVRQDRALAAQRAQEQRDNAAGLAVAALQRRLSVVEEQLTALAALPADELPAEVTELSRDLAPDAVLLIFKPGELEAHPAGRLLYYPVAATQVEAPAGAFTQAEAAEFQQKDYAAAVAVLKESSRSPDTAIRVEALVRLGRTLRKTGRWEDAVAVYDELSRIRGAAVRGIPVDLLARAARCELLDERKAGGDLRPEAATLYSDLNNGRWRVQRAVYDVYAAQLARFLDPATSPPAPPHGAALSDAVQTLWQEWMDDRPPRHRHTLWSADRPMLVITRRAAERTLALLLGPDHLGSGWLPEVQSIAQSHHARIALTDSEGRAVVDQVRGEAPVSLRGASATGLPWTVHAISIPSGNDPETFSIRSRIVLGGLMAIALLVVGGSYLIARAVVRELAVARLQSDFVTAVSHEFRTPLTALRQLSELLARGRVLNDGVRQQYYEVMEHESARLHRLVEGLLNFGRMEAGAMRYHFETIDAAELLRAVVAEFRAQAERRGCRVEFNANGTVAHTRADREALGCVVWNLLDNAVKYSPDRHTVWIELGHVQDRVAIRVRDQGVGIPREEQERIFQKFVRGQGASGLGVQGAGIGLAVVREIVTTHGGEIKIESTPGTGSTFTVLLPCAK